MTSFGCSKKVRDTRHLQIRSSMSGVGYWQLHAEVTCCVIPDSAHVDDAHCNCGQYQLSRVRREIFYTPARSYIPYTQHVLLLLSVSAEKAFECFPLTHVRGLISKNMHLFSPSGPFPTKLVIYSPKTQY